jgi:hypothetical protein
MQERATPGYVRVCTGSAWDGTCETQKYALNACVALAAPYSANVSGPASFRECQILNWSAAWVDRFRASDLTRVLCMWQTNYYNSGKMLTRKRSCTVYTLVLGKQTGGCFWTISLTMWAAPQLAPRLAQILSLSLLCTLALLTSEHGTRRLSLTESVFLVAAETKFDQLSQCVGA